MSASVFIAMPTATAHPHMESAGSASRLKESGQADRFEIFPGGSVPVQTVRNAAVDRFLDGDWSHLLFIDDDTVVPKHTIEYLLALDCGIAAGMVPSLFVGSGRTFLNCRAPKQGWYMRWPDGPVDIDCCGMACTLIQREVFMAVGWPWFSWLESHDERRIFGEDLTFCAKAHVHDFTLRADGRVQCDHKKEIGLKQFVPQDGPLYIEEREDDGPGMFERAKARIYTAV